jgi:hypothetical protein
MRLWVQVFSSRERNPNFHEALEAHLRSVVEPGTQIEVHGTHKGGLGEQFRFFQAIDYARYYSEHPQVQERKRY